MNVKATLLWIGCLSALGCSVNAHDINYQNIEAIRYSDKVYLEQEQVSALLKNLQSEHAKSMHALHQQINRLSSRVDAIESKQGDRTTIEIVDSSTLVWVCTLSPTFEDRSFISKAATQAEATFTVIDQCLSAGVSDFYCKKSKVECTDK